MFLVIMVFPAMVIAPIVLIRSPIPIYPNSTALKNQKGQNNYEYPFLHFHLPPPVPVSPSCPPSAFMMPSGMTPLPSMIPS